MHLWRVLFIFLICASAGAAGIFVVFFERDWVDLACFEQLKGNAPTLICDGEGAVIASLTVDKRAPINFDDLPKHLIHAFVAAEDHMFFSHQGISLRGIVRSTFVNLINRRVVQGASTITQQLSRLMFLNHERTFMRKITEIFVAFQLERQLSKEQIFELYVNNIYFGRGIYGAEAACRRMWNCSVHEISLAQAATLAAVAKSAALYSPLNAPANATRRRNSILHQMHTLGFITQQQRDQGLAEHLKIRDFSTGNQMRLYVQEYVRQWAEETFGKDVVYKGGLTIYTTLNEEIQEKAEKAFAQGVIDIRHKLKKPVNGGLLSVEPSTGQIKAYIGGYDFKESQYDRAFQAQRQMGSSFKPYIFALAMKFGIPMNRVYVDEPIEMQMPAGDVWRPRNWNRRFEGPMTLARALTVSNNMITIKLFMEIGPRYIIPWVNLFGLHRCLNDYPSAALGTTEATVYENVAAFNVFANNGVWVKPYLIQRVVTTDGVELYRHIPETRRIIDAPLATRMVNLMSLRMDVARQQSKDGWFGAESIGKTGSTNDVKTTWFVGATPDLTTALYVGSDDNRPMGDALLAGRSTFPIWKNLYKQLTVSKKFFYKDPTVGYSYINWFTGKQATALEQNIVTLATTD